MQVTATERKLVELYRNADTKSKQAAMKILRGTATTTEEAVGGLLGSAVELLLGKNSKESSRSIDPDLEEAEETAGPDSTEE